jgi:hypothetical protein
MMIEHVCAMRRLWSEKKSWLVQFRLTATLTPELVGCLLQHLDQIRVCCLQVEVLRHWDVRHDCCEGRPSSWLICVSKRATSLYQIKF